MLEGPEGTTAAGFFFGDVMAQAPRADDPSGGLTAQVQELVSELERIDQRLTNDATPAQQARLNAERTDVLEKLAEAAEGTSEYENWIRQLADTVSAAVQSGQYPEGVQRLAKLRDQVVASKQPQDLVAYVMFRFLSAEYGQKLQEPEADFAKIQEDWLANLETFVETYPRSDDAAEAILQLAIAQEFAGEEDKAIAWYGRIVEDFSSSNLAAKAAGAKRRLESVGKTISLSGTTTEGRKVSLASYRGRVAVIHYWATWCEPCKEDMQVLRQLQAKYADRELAIIGVNLDTDDQAVSEYLSSNRLPWPQLRESEGLDGRLANEMGIVTLPTMLLIDQDGEVVNRGIHVSELDTEIAKLLK
jgi:thiol-disulfide isomerase/thioredoxin